MCDKVEYKRVFKRVRRSQRAKRCAVCGEKVELGNGTYRYGRLIHRLCIESAKLVRRRLK